LSYVAICILRSLRYCRFSIRSRYSEPMQVQVLYFGVLREQMGRPDQSTEVADGASVADLLSLLQAQSSNAHMGGLWQRLAVAVNREYAAASHILRDGDEVALLPPVSGGMDA
jgi:molybdopterin converting factor subunit 1